MTELIGIKIDIRYQGHHKNSDVRLDIYLDTKEYLLVEKI